MLARVHNNRVGRRVSNFSGFTKFMHSDLAQSPKVTDGLLYEGGCSTSTASIRKYQQSSVHLKVLIYY